MELCGSGLPLWAPASSSQQRLLRRCSTYLAKISVVLQCAPEKMLLFSQLMDKLMPLVSENRRSFENNVRVCLSTNKCFVKVPAVSDWPDSKRNYWKLDSGQITPKMVRRHFKGILQLFPELASKLVGRIRSSEGPLSLKQGPEAAAAAAAAAAACRGEERRQGEFSGPFSIRFLLRSDGPSARASGSSPPSGLKVGAERRQVEFSGPFSIRALLRRDDPAARASTSSPPSELKVGAEQWPGFRTERNFSWEQEETLLLLHLQQRWAWHSTVCSTGGSTHPGLAANPCRCGETRAGGGLVACFQQIQCCSLLHQSSQQLDKLPPSCLYP